MQTKIIPEILLRFIENLLRNFVFTRAGKVKQVQAPHLSDPEERETLYTSFAFLRVAGRQAPASPAGIEHPELGPSATAASAMLVGWIEPAHKRTDRITRAAGCSEGSVA